LPKTLNEVYQRFLRHRCPFRKWSDRYQSILGTLTVTQEAISRERLTKFTSVDSQQIQDALDVLQQFLDEVEDEQGQKRYAIFHQSLREYLLDRKHNQDFWCDAKEQHDLIISCYEKESETWQELRQIDRYGLRYLAQHLVQAEQTEELHTLLSLEKDGRNAWFDAKEQIEDAAGFLADVRLAWAKADETVEQEPEVAITLQCRYALITASINSVASNIPSELLFAIVENNLNTEHPILTPIQALTYARQMPDSEQKAKSLSNLALYLSEPLRSQVLQEALTAARNIKYNYSRLETLKNLIPYLSQEFKEQVFLEALQTARSANLLSNLIPYLPEQLRAETIEEALELVKVIEEFDSRIRELLKLVHILPESLLQKALELVRKIFCEIDASILLEQAPEKLNQEISQVVLQSVNEKIFKISFVLQELAQNFPNNQRNEILQQCLEIARKFLHGWNKILLLSCLIPELSDSLKIEVINETIRAALTIISETTGIEVLEQEASIFPTVKVHRTQIQAMLYELKSAEPLDIVNFQAMDRATPLPSSSASEPTTSEIMLQKILKTVSRVEDEQYKLLILLPAIFIFTSNTNLKSDHSGIAEFLRVKLMSTVIPILPQVQRKLITDIALNLARKIEIYSWRPIFMKNNEFYRTQALSYLIPYLPEPEQLQVFDEALRNIRSILHLPDVEKTLISLVAKLPASLKCKVLGKILEVVKSFGSDDYQVNFKISTFKKLSSELPEVLKTQVLQEAFVAVGEIKDQRSQIHQLTSLASFLPETLSTQALRKALAAVKRVNDKSYQVQILIALAQAHPSETLLQTTLEILETIDTDEKKIEALIAITPYLPEPLLQRGLTMAQASKDAFYRTWSLGKIAQYSSEPLKSSIIREAIATAELVEAPYNRLNVLVKLLLGLSEPQAFDFLVASPRLLRAIPESLESRIVQDALLAAKNSNYDNAWALLELLPHLSKSEKTQVLRGIISVWKKDNLTGGASLDILIRYMPFLTMPMLVDALLIIRGLQIASSRVEGLAAISQYLAKPLRGWILRKALVTAQTLKHERFQNYERAKSLIHIVPYLSEPYKAQIGQEALVYIRSIPEKDKRVYLAKLVPHLKEPLRTQIIEEAMKIDDINEREFERFEAIGVLAPYLPKHHLIKALKMVRSTQYGNLLSNRTEAIQALSKRLVDLPPSDIYSFWNEIFHEFSRYERKGLLEQLEPLIWILTALGKIEIIEQLFNTIQSVCRQWA
jgi:hypothetical protein